MTVCCALSHYSVFGPFKCEICAQTPSPTLSGDNLAGTLGHYPGLLEAFRAYSVTFHYIRPSDGRKTG